MHILEYSITSPCYFDTLVLFATFYTKQTLMLTANNIP